MRVQIIKQFSVFMPNRPGALSNLAKIFADKGINLVGIASEVRDDAGMVRLAVTGDQDVSSLLSGAGFPSVESRLISIEVPDRPGELYRIAKILGDGKINITTVYGTILDGNSTRILLAVEDTDKAHKLISSLDPSA